METIGKYHNRTAIWLDDYMNEMPNENWICFVISNTKPNHSSFDSFAKKSIENGILEFKAGGLYGELVHDLFDYTKIDMEIQEGYETINICTTWHNDESIADVFWQCFFSTTLPVTADYDNITIACFSLNNENYCDDLKSYIKRFEEGWIPE